MPASRSARAMTLAPRSWPSSPGLATRTLIFRLDIRCGLKGGLFVDSVNVSERRADLAERCINSNCVDRRRHRVLVFVRRGFEFVERVRHRACITLRTCLFESFELVCAH